MLYREEDKIERCMPVSSTSRIEHQLSQQPNKQLINEIQVHGQWNNIYIILNEIEFQIIIHP